MPSPVAISNDVAGEHPQRGLQLYVEGTQLVARLGSFPGDRKELRNVVRLGQVFEVQQLGGLISCSASRSAA